MGQFQLQAAISAVHAEAQSLETTRWPEIVGLYDLLLQLQPNPLISLNRAVAVSFARSVEAAMIELSCLRTELEGYQPFHAALADCLRRSGLTSEAKMEYDRAIELSGNPRERAYLARRASQMGQP